MSTIAFTEYEARKCAVRLQMYRKRLTAPPKGGKRPVLFLVHGSSMSARGAFDLTVPGADDYSVMDAFARRGYDVWTVDHEGYGRSDKTSGNSNIADGVRDLQASIPIVLRETGAESVQMFGQSSGALRAAAYAASNPERVERLVLAAFVWTGDGAPTLIKRRERLKEWQSSNVRKVDPAFYDSMFTRDRPGLSDMAVPKAMCEFEKPFGGTVPTGTYLDMCANLPVVDPKDIRCPTMILRGDHDGIADDEDLLAFFVRLPSKDKQFVMVSGLSHSTHLGFNRHRVHHILDGFLSLPERRDPFAAEEAIALLKGAAE